MKRFALITSVAVLAYVSFVVVNGVTADGGGHHGGGHHGGGHHGGGHHGGGHHGGGHGFHVSLGLGHHHHSYFSYPNYGYRSNYYRSYYYPSYSRYYAYPSQYGYYADSYYCGQPATVYRTSPQVEAAPRPSEPVEEPNVEPAPPVVPDELPNQPATQHQLPRAYLSALSVSSVRPIVSDEQAPWIVSEDVHPGHDRGSTLATSEPLSDKR